MTDLKATPQTPKEWEEYVNTALETPEKFQAAFADGSFKEAMAAYTGATNKTMTDLKDQMTEQVSASVLEMFKRNGVATDGRPDVRPVNERAARAGAAYVDGAPGAGVEGVWNSGGQLLQDLLLKKQGKEGKEARARLEQYEEKLLNYSPHVPSEGGLLIPEQVRSTIMTRALEGAVVRPQATVVPMPTGKLRWPINDMTTEVGSVYGGIAFAWLDAGENFPLVEAAFAALSLEAHKLGGLASVPNELIRFAPALEVWLRENLPNGIREFEDRAFMKGDGIDKPMGGLNPANPALITVGGEVGQPAATVTWVNILAMFARLLPESYTSAEWDITPDAIPEIFTMALPVGTGGSAVMMGEGGGPNRLAQTMLGLPIRWTRKAPGLLGTQGDVSLADWKQYVIADSLAIQFDTSEHSSFRADKTDFRILEHVDGQPAQLSPLTPENGGPTLSSFVQLATR
ncbi:MAG: phage major capsid protein [Jiangellaceae bacterium]